MNKYTKLIQKYKQIDQGDNYCLRKINWNELFGE